jgi:hypothetical protein
LLYPNGGSGADPSPAPSRKLDVGDSGWVCCGRENSRNE